MTNKLVIILILFTTSYFTKAQSNEQYLKDYIHYGLKNNLEIQSNKDVIGTYEAKRGQALSNFLPKVELSSRYTRAGGGRSFEFPLGSMLNPIYDSLHIPLHFDDMKESFIRQTEQDSKIELIQPIFNLSILNNYNYVDEQYQSALHEYNAKEINLIYSIKEKYYNYLKSLLLVDIGKSALELANENLNVVNKLFEVDRSPSTDVLRAEVLVQNSIQDLQIARNMVILSKNTFNQQVNQDFDKDIKHDSLTIEDFGKSEQQKALNFQFNLEQAMQTALEKRPELKQMNSMLKSLEYAKKAVNSDFLPSLSLVADYGIQGEQYNLDTENRYWMISGVFKWNLFSGFETKYKSEELLAQSSSIKNNLESIKQLITLEVKNNYLNYRTNLDLLKVADKAYKSALENYRLNKLRYQEGLGQYISFLDSQTTLVTAQTNYILSFYNILATKALLEKSIGLGIENN